MPDRRTKDAPARAGTASRESREAASLAEFVESEVRQAVVSGRYHPGDKLRESEIAEWLQVSRTPVREALRRLEAEGLVVSEPRRGAVVSKLDRQQIMELYAVREVLEGTAARLAAKHASEVEIGMLEELVTRQRTSGDSSDKVARINTALHNTIHGAAHNRYLTQMLGALASSLALLPGTPFTLPGRSEEALKEHAAVVSAIKRRDPDAAEAAARRHIRQAERARFRMLFEQE